MASCQDHVIGVFIGNNVLIQILEIPVNQLVCLREALFCHKIFSVIHDGHMKAQHFSQMGGRLGYVTAAENSKPWIFAIVFHENPNAVGSYDFCFSSIV